MFNLFRELLVAEGSHLLILIITSLVIKNNPNNANEYLFFGVIASCAVCAIFNGSYKEWLKGLRLYMQRKTMPTSNANENKYNENIEPFVENLSEIVRPYLVSDEAAFSFAEKIETNLSQFCANNWRRAFGKIEKKYYIVIYSNTERLNVGEAAYCGNGEWQIFSETPEELNPPLTVIAFSDKKIEKGEKNGEIK